MNDFKLIVFPLAFVIVLLAIVVPVTSELQLERCSLAFDFIMESDLIGSRTSEEVLADCEVQKHYLMKHPRKTLRLCIDFEAVNNDNRIRANINRRLAEGAYHVITGESIVFDEKGIAQQIKSINPHLAEEYESP